GPRRRGLQHRPSGGAFLPRRARDDDLRGHLADPAADHRTPADGPRRAEAARGRARDAARVNPAELPSVVGVAGAGTMGAGIAQLAATIGARTILFDPVAGAAGRGATAIEKSLAKAVERGKI